MGPAARIVPVLDDLPGGGWEVIDLPEGGDPSGEAELIDCVGDDFPRGDELVDSATSAHFLRRRQLVHGIAVVFASAEAAARAVDILRSATFAACLGRSVAADLTADPHGAEVLAVDVGQGGPPHRVTFAGASRAGMLSVHLDIVVVHRDVRVCLLWFGDAPQPFPEADRDELVARLSARLARDDPGPDLPRP